MHSLIAAHVDLVCVSIILGFSIFFFTNLGNGSLWTADETTYSQWAAHMTRTGDYLTPWAFGTTAVWLAKPPLYMWLMSLAYQIFGINNFATRIWSPIFGTLSCIFIFYLGKNLYNPLVGLSSALVLGTFTTFYLFARHAMLDVPLIFFMLAAIYFLILSAKSEKGNRLAALGGLFLGLAIMTKQMDALLILIIGFLYLAITRRSLKFLFSKWFTLFWGIALLVCLPWLIYMGYQFKSDFWQQYFLFSIVQRSLSPLEGHVGGPLYYLRYLLTTENMLWITLLPFAIGLCIFNSFLKRKKGDILLLVWIIVIFGVFTLVQTKIHWYILPAYPALAIAISSFLYQYFKKLKLLGLLPISTLLVLLVYFGILFGLPY
jgi:4-amino-4-deoxy-L-arabinose transferase-like glycosyltransferase